MHDIRSIRSHPDAFDAALARRAHAPVAEEILALDERKRTTATAIQDAQAKRNGASKAIGQAMAGGDTAKADALKAEVATLKETMPALEQADREAGEALKNMLAGLPNLPADDVPDGADESDNVEIARWGELPAFDFEPREHADIGPALGMDFETGAKLVRRALYLPARRHGPPAPCARPVHDRPADAGEWLYRMHAARAGAG